MLFTLIILFTVLPLLEFYLLIKIGTIIGAFSTILIILGTGILGAFLARDQGFRVIKQITSDLGYGIFPAGPLWEGLFVLIGAIFLITPGLLTDLAGFICIIPLTRKPLKKIIKSYISKKLNQEGIIDIHVF